MLPADLRGPSGCVGDQLGACSMHVHVHVGHSRRHEHQYKMSLLIIRIRYCHTMVMYQLYGMQVIYPCLALVINQIYNACTNKALVTRYTSIACQMAPRNGSRLLLDRSTQVYTAYFPCVGAGWLYCLVFPRYDCVIIAMPPPTPAVVFDTLVCYDTDHIPTLAQASCIRALKRLDGSLTPSYTPKHRFLSCIN